MSSRSPFSEQEAKDKKMIDRGIVESKRFLESKKFDSAKERLSQISPASRRLNYKQYDIAILYSFLMTKQEKWQEAKPYVQSATRLKPDEPVPWKLLIQVESKIGTDESLIQTLKRAMETSRPDGSLLTFIGPYLKKFDDENLTDSYIRLIEIIPNGVDLPLVSFIPEIPKTLDIRTRMLERSASSNEESCSELIHILLSEDDPFKTKKYAEMLPPDHPDRLYVEAMIGDDPVGSARKHLKTGNNRFFDFLRAVDSHNLQQIRAEVSVIPSFASGWSYLATQEKDPKNRILILNDASSKFPNCISFVKMLAEAKEESGDIDGAISTITKSIISVDDQLGSEMLIKLYIRQGRCKEAADLVKTDKAVSISDSDRATIELELFKEDNDVSHLKRIINDFPLTPELAGIKAEAAWSLRDEMEQEELEKLFIKALQCDQFNGRCLLMYGKWQLDYKHDEERATMMLKKAAELGFVDPESSELLTRKFINEGKIDEALSILNKVDTEWSHFRSALIYQRKGDHENAAKEFQIDLRFNPKRFFSWSAIGHEYVVLGRAMAARSVADQLRQMGTPDVSLEFEICSIFGRPIKVTNNSIDAIDFEENPIPFYAYMQQTIEKVKNLKRLGRKESARIVAEKLKESVVEYIKKWDYLSTVLKICGDFYIELCPLCDENEICNYADQAIYLFKKRCEIEKRAESFIDFAHAIQINRGPQKVEEYNRQIEKSIEVLKSSIRLFPDHSGLWTSLGVSYALASQYPLSMHCLCVASKLATDMEQARSYSCIANVALLLDDFALLEEALQTARSSNPYDSDVWQILTASKQHQEGVGNNDDDDDDYVDCDEKERIQKENQKAEDAIIAFRFGSTNSISSCISDHCLKSDRLFECLGYALIEGNSKKISIAFEALGKYDLALLYANEDEDEERKSRLLLLADKISEGDLHQKFPNISLYKEGKFTEAADKFTEKNDFYSNLAAAICYSKSGEIERAMEIFNELRDCSPFPSQVEKIMLQVVPKDEEIESQLAQKSPDLFFLLQLRSCSRIEAAKNLIKRFPSDLAAISIFVLEVLKSKEVGDVLDMALTKARALYAAQPGLKSLTLMTMCMVRMGENEEAFRNLQILYLLNPSIAQKIGVVIDAVIRKIQGFH